MNKPLLAIALLSVSLGLMGCAGSDDPVIREESATGVGTPQEPFSAKISDSNTPAVDPADGNDNSAPTSNEAPPQSLPQFDQ